MAISLKTKSDIDKLRAANKIVAQTLNYIEGFLKPGITLSEIDKLIEDFILSKGALPAFKGLYNFPNASCLSLNEVVIHGIPDNTVLQNGDILGIDIGTKLDGYFGDAAKTFGIGQISKVDTDLINCSKEALYFAIDNIKVGMHFKELSYKIEQFILSKGFVPLYGFCGHGIGKKPHEEPQIPNYLEGTSFKQGPKIKNGMVFCLEPMICQKDSNPKILEDKWAVISKDGLRTSHYEHTVAVYDNLVEILSIEEGR